MKHKLSACYGDAGIHDCHAKPEHTTEKPLPLWRASARMALVVAVSVAAVGVIATGMTGCADMSGIESKAVLRDALSLGLPVAVDTPNAVSAQWWEGFGDEQLSARWPSARKPSSWCKTASTPT